jgi:hypothetical protein
MAGGPINGVPVPVFDIPIPLSGIEHITENSETQTIGLEDEVIGYSITANYKTRAVGLVIPTILQTSLDIINWFTSITCLYNKHWYAEEDRVTLPIVFFHVTGISEDWQVTTSKKRVLLYEPDEEIDVAEAANPVREGVMQTIVDNRVVEPKTYNLSVIVPAQPLGRRFTEGIKTATDMVFGMLDIMGGLAGKVSGVSAARSILSLSLQGIGIVQHAVDIQGKLPGMDGASYINKNSLEAMIESGLILTMKMWTGFDYKFVMITGGHIEKKPAEDDVFRGTLQLQEIPVLTITPPKEKRASELRRQWSPLADGLTPGNMELGLRTQLAAVAPLIQFTGVGKASGDTKTTYRDMLSSLGM